MREVILEDSEAVVRSVQPRSAGSDNSTLNEDKDDGEGEGGGEGGGESEDAGGDEEEERDAAIVGHADGDAAVAASHDAMNAAFEGGGGRGEEADEAAGYRDGEWHDPHDPHDNLLLEAVLKEAIKVASLPTDGHGSGAALAFTFQEGQFKEELEACLACLRKEPAERSDEELNYVRLSLGFVEFFRKVEDLMPQNVVEVLREAQMQDLSIMKHVFEQGDRADGMYIIVQGGVDVFVLNKQTNEAFKVCTLTAGESFGELVSTSHTLGDCRPNLAQPYPALPNLA